MRIEKVRKLVWGVDTVVLLAVGFCFYQFFFSPGADQAYDKPGEWTRRPRGESEGPPLPDPDPWSSYARLTAFPMDGERPVKVEAAEGPEGPAESTDPLARLAELLSYWRWDPSTDMASVLLKLKAGGDPVAIRIGEKIPGTAWQLVNVEGDRAIFRNTKEPDAQASLERVAAPAAGDAGTRIVASGAEGGVEPAVPAPAGGVEPRLDAIEISPGRYQLGAGEEAYLGDEQRVEEIRQSVSAEPWKNPETEKYEGLRIRKLEENSYIARRGGERGDILLSINGQPVTTREDVINYVKGPGKNEKQFVVNILRNGQPRTLVYNRK